mmetsp:Transcript_18759/g.39175  ORF Transcript_18759/g.39175 Transcript_18759/m.39175 type:complete len:205 (+) Transcript_18759:2502-3116(+)
MSMTRIHHRVVQIISYEQGPGFRSLVGERGCSGCCTNESRGSVTLVAFVRHPSVIVVIVVDRIEETVRQICGSCVRSISCISIGVVTNMVRASRIFYGFCKPASQRCRYVVETRRSFVPPPFLPWLFTSCSCSCSCRSIRSSSTSYISTITILGPQACGSNKARWHRGHYLRMVPSCIISHPRLLSNVAGWTGRSHFGSFSGGG